MGVSECKGTRNTHGECEMLEIKTQCGKDS